MTIENAMVVLQCAGRKARGAGTFISPEGKPVRFVAHPERAPDNGECYAHPDDRVDRNDHDKQTWRQKLHRYNRNESVENPCRLKRAGELYGNPVYSKLLHSLGCNRFFLLSPGWGLVRSDYLLPDYDITFSNQAPMVSEGIGREVIRRVWGRDCSKFRDASFLPDETSECVVFIGSKDYQKLFVRLTQNISALRIVYHNSDYTVEHPGCTWIRYETTRRQNWHYGCANDFLSGKLDAQIEQALTESGW